LQPEWDKLPSKIGKRVRIAKIDATVNRKMAQKYGIKGFPTLLFFST
jgi:protein disulfide-isomerase A6